MCAIFLQLLLLILKLIDALLHDGHDRLLQQVATALIDTCRRLYRRVLLTEAIAKEALVVGGLDVARGQTLVLLMLLLLMERGHQLGL